MHRFAAFKTLVGMPVDGARPIKVSTSPRTARPDSRTLSPRSLLAHPCASLTRLPGAQVGDNLRIVIARLAPLLFVLAFVPQFVAAQSLDALVGTRFDARVVSVADGDTVTVVTHRSGRRIRVRLEGIDTPERGEPFSQRARQMTRVLLFDQSVRVDARDVDRYGRLVARLVVSGRDSSVALVGAGLACYYTVFATDPALARAEATARSSGAGFWARGADRPRCVAKRRR